MAEVFKAKLTGECGFQKLVAIKRVQPHLSRNPDFLAMFMEEARLAALLSHPNIVQVFDFGSVDGTYFISMEYLRGDNLKAILNRAGSHQPLPLECSLTVASRICAALEYAHNLKDMSGAPLGIIHCDINPQNVLITRLGEVKVLDFGIARMTARSRTERMGTLQGKVRYMSPEQACCLPVDRRSDIFSIGALLHEMVTGQQAFHGDVRDAYQRVRRCEYTPPRCLAPELPEDVIAILRTAMARQPEERFASCAEMHARLEHCLTSRFERLSSESLARRIRLLPGSEDSGGLRGKPRAETLLGLLNRWEPRLGITLHSRKARARPRKPPGSGALGKAWTIKAPKPLLAALACCVWLTVFLVFPSPVQNPHGDQVQEALQAVEDRSFGKALLLFEKLLTQNPGLLGEVAAPYADALLQEGIRLSRSHPRMGMQLIGRCIELDSSNARAHFEMGKLHTRRKQYPTAVEHYEKAIRADASYPEAHFNLGFLYARMEDFARAEEMYRRTVELAPPFVDEAYFNLAMVQRIQGKTRECIRSLERAFAANPHNRQAAEYLERLKRGA